MNKKLTLLSRYQGAIKRVGLTNEEAAKELIKNPRTKKPYSYRYIIDALKYPDKNQKLVDSALKFIEQVESMEPEPVKQS